MAHTLADPTGRDRSGVVEPGPNEQEIARLARSDQTSWWIRGRRALISAVLKAQAHAMRGTVADLGCGAGGMLEPLREYGGVVGIDISPLAVTLCRSKGYRGLAMGTLERLPLREDTLALTGMTDVLEHVPDDRRVVRECLRALKPGGMLLITVPALQWLYGEHDRALGHVRRYSRAGLRALLEECGFHVERITYFNTLLLPLVIVARLLCARGAPRPQADPLDLGNPWNWLAYHMLLLERAIIRVLDLPVGLSLLCVARKPAAGGGAAGRGMAGAPGA
ncbi:MAG: methyltransferase domain-containing protein [Armatimonadota bacterium]